MRFGSGPVGTPSDAQTSIIYKRKDLGTATGQTTDTVHRKGSFTSDLLQNKHLNAGLNTRTSQMSSGERFYGQTGRRLREHCGVKSFPEGLFRSISQRGWNNLLLLQIN